MTRSTDITPFPISPGDPLAKEQAAVAAWVEAAFALVAGGEFYRSVDLKTLPSGQTLLDGKPDQSRRFVMAAVAQLRHWDEQAAQFRHHQTDPLGASTPQFLPGWAPIWGRRRQAGAVLSTLMRRSLPFQPSDLVAIVTWCNSTEPFSSYIVPVGVITRALERHGAGGPVDEELRTALQAFAARLRASDEKDVRKLATAVEQLAGAAVPARAAAAPPAVPRQPSPAPARAGTAHILEPLKTFFGMEPIEPAPRTGTCGLDHFPLDVDSPLKSEHEALNALIEELAGSGASPRPVRGDRGGAVSHLVGEACSAGRLLLAAAERHVNALTRQPTDVTDPHFWRARAAAFGIVEPFLTRDFELDRAGLFDLLLYLSVRPAHARPGMEAVHQRWITRAEREAAQTPLSEGERFVLGLLRASLLLGPAFGTPPEEVVRLTRLIGDDQNFYLVPGEAWSDAVNADLTDLAPDQALRWVALLRHALTATTARPSARWQATARSLVEAIGAEAVQESILRWLPLVSQGRSIPNLGQPGGEARAAGDVMNDENATILRGLLWLTRALPRPDELTRPIAAVALSAYKKVPGVGPRAVKVGNAAVLALSGQTSIEAVGQLAKLKVRIKVGTAQKEIGKAFTAAAEALGLPRDQIEELGVPSYGLEEVGLRRETLGAFQAELRVSGSDVHLDWRDAKGKALKSVPARVRCDHPDELKELRQSLQDIQSMLPAQRDRLDAMFLLQKSWPWTEWAERYLNHPLVGTIARRLIWRVDGVPCLFRDGQPTDVNGAVVSVGPSAGITLWHPVGCPVEEVTAWRRRLEALGVTQPFRQAHREVYLLTDAERRTRTYSNRFAAHVVRQHQFSALCAARGWKNPLRLMVDDTFPPATKELPRWGLSAEFWVEGIGDGYGTDTNESGVYLRLATDQVRFYRRPVDRDQAVDPAPGDPGEPLPLESIPPLVLSEILRDVDLFVGVSSVGNDPTWQDGGPGGRYRDYWQHYSFGELSGTAATRKQVLERLVPRLKIADRCSFSERFLVVRGNLRTYKIHLGSGNILMEPNDEYLCIVPDSRSRATQDGPILPFEGDGTLSIILSKALLLAADTTIQDPTITRQIHRR